MKKYYTLIIMATIFLFVASCKKDNPILPDSIEEEEEEVVVEKDKTPGAPSYILVTTKYDGGTVMLSWKELDKTRVKAINISYNKDDVKEEITITDFTDGFLELKDLVIGDQYDFTITATGMNDQLSAPYQVSVTPKAFAATIVGKTLNPVLPSGLSATVNWVNETRTKVKVQVKVNGTNTYESAFSDSKNGEFIIPQLVVPSLVAGELTYNFEVTLMDQFDGISELKTNTVTLVKELAVSTNWDISVSTGDAEKGNLLDGKLNTFWGAAYSPPAADDSPTKNDKYPNHWIVIDMKKVVASDQIALAPRHDHTNGFNKFSLQGSLDGKTYFPILSNELLNVNLKALQPFSFDLQDVRYVKIIPLDGEDAWRSTNLAEFQLYNYKIK